MEDADALCDVLAAQGTSVQPLAAGLAAADMATGQENHLGLGEKTGERTQRVRPSRTAHPSTAVLQHRRRWGSPGGVTAWEAEPRSPIAIPRHSAVLCAHKGLGCADSTSAMGLREGHGSGLDQAAP